VTRSSPSQIYTLSLHDALPISGRPVRVLNRIEPVAGFDLRLSLDLGLQRLAERLFTGYRGALVAIEPATGEVLAFVSSPSFDPNLFIDGIDKIGRAHV